VEEGSSPFSFCLLLVELGTFVHRGRSDGTPNPEHIREMSVSTKAGPQNVAAVGQPSTLNPKP
jgi:hypothetical protein